MNNPNKLPQWFRYVLPFLSGRQNTADFEAWLYSPDAETALPEDVYHIRLFCGRITAKTERIFAAV